MTISRLFRPTAPQLGLLVALGGAALGAALYLRYGVIEQAAVGIACNKGPMTTLCGVRAATIVLLLYTVFGTIAILSALVNLFRPSFAWLALALTAAGFGIVLYNTRLSALAVALMLLSLARPAPATA